MFEFAKRWRLVELSLGCAASLPCSRKMLRYWGGGSADCRFISSHGRRQIFFPRTVNRFIKPSDSIFEAYFPNPILSEPGQRTAAQPSTEIRTPSWWLRLGHWRRTHPARLSAAKRPSRNEKYEWKNRTLRLFLQKQLDITSTT